ncbi:MAG: CHAT domain-containing protein [Symploca sp. SIO3E6]|nr:CHAT domain-containing protein [Caldora sp. SIO3E6]
MKDMAAGGRRDSPLTAKEAKDAIENTVRESIPPGKKPVTQATQTRLAQLQQQLDDLINREILPIDPSFSLTQKIEPISFEQIQSLIDEDTAILEWYLGDDNFLVFIITRQSESPIVWQSSSEDNSALMHWANEYWHNYYEDQQAWQEQLSRRLENLAHILHLDEILDYLPETFDQLILIPHRILNCFPLHALPLADGSCLLDRFFGRVRYVPSCQLLQLIQTRQRPEFTNFLGIQNPGDNLPFADLEIEMIKGYFPSVNVLARTAATKDALNNQTLNSVHCLHFSGNSAFNRYSPLQSALFLADSLISTIPANSNPSQYWTLSENAAIDLSKCLTVEEIFQLDLSQCRLVNLSACETALTDWTSASDEYIGFPSAFLLAGSASVVGSLWAPSDLSTALLMIELYRNLQLGSTVEVALNEAQIWLRDITKRELEQWIVKQLQLPPAVKMNLRRRLYQFEDDAQPFREPLHWAAFCAIGQ